MLFCIKPNIGCSSPIFTSGVAFNALGIRQRKIDTHGCDGIFRWMKVLICLARWTSLGLVCVFGLVFSGCMNTAPKETVAPQTEEPAIVEPVVEAQVTAPEEVSEPVAAIESSTPPPPITEPTQSNPPETQVPETSNNQISYEELVTDEVTTPEDPDIVHTYRLPLYGWVEWACIMPDAIRMKAKLDSGAKTSSISAHDIVQFERDGERWVRFIVENPETGLSHEMERPLSRRVRIIRHENEPQRRPVVELEVKVGDVHQLVEFSLIDRGNFIYPILIGRNFMRGHILLDSDNTFLAPRPCE